jgi:hypothetical protein
MFLETAKVDVQTVVAGYRAKVIGNSVLNDESETIGKIDDSSWHATAMSHTLFCRSVAF